MANEYDALLDSPKVASPYDALLDAKASPYDSLLTEEGVQKPRVLSPEESDKVLSLPVAKVEAPLTMRGVGKIVEGLSEPFSHIPRPPLETASYLAHELGATDLVDKTIGTRTLDVAASGLVDAASSLAEFFTSPLGFATLGLGAAPKLVQKGAGLAFAAQAIKHSPEAVMDLINAPNDETRAAALSKVLQDVGVGIAGTAHGISRSAEGVRLPGATPLQIETGIRERDSLRSEPSDARYSIAKTDVLDPIVQSHDALAAQLEKEPNPELRKTLDAVKNQLFNVPEEAIAASRERIAQRQAAESPLAPSAEDIAVTPTSEDSSALSDAAKLIRPHHAPGQQDEPIVSRSPADWTSATAGEEQPPLGMKRGGGQSGAVNIPQFADRKMSELDAATTFRSTKMQQSFGEAQRAQKEIAKVAPTEKRQGAISVWMEANGDPATLAGWEAGAKGKVFREAAKAAQTLSPSEIDIAQRAKTAFDVLGKRGQKFEVLKSFQDNYVPHVWEVDKGGIGSRRLQEKFKFAKARTFENFAEGDAAGFTPKTLAIGKLLPAYLHEMNKVIADRQFVQSLGERVAKDGRPLTVPRGRVSGAVSPEGDYATMINPDAFKNMKDNQGNPIDTSDYKTMDHPALHDWRWESKDLQGNPIFMRDDLAVHPEATKRIKAMMGQSAIKEWYNTPSEGSGAIPKAIIKGLDVSQSVMKREMFGLLAPFHQVQEGTHAIAHRVNPFFGLEKVDMQDARFVDAARHGLMILPDRATASGYMEGLGGKGTFLTQAARFIGEKNEGLPGDAARGLANVVDGYQNYLFHQYIPSLKFKTYEAIAKRNMDLYTSKLKSGELTPADVKLLSAEQTNAAYGHLNRDLLDRDPTMNHLLQLGLLAPDFLEARGRFVGQAAKGLTGSPVGREQLQAVAFLALVQAGSAYVLSKLSGDDYDPTHPFSVMHEGREYTMRSVPEDMLKLGVDVKNLAQGDNRGLPFASARLNPVVSSVMEGVTGKNYRGEKVSALDTTEELLAKYIPITARSIPGLRDLTETSRKSPISPLEQLAGSLGLKISRHSPITETYANAYKWMEKNDKLKDKGTYPTSPYQQLRYALEDGDTKRAQDELETLKKKMGFGAISKGFHASINHPFTGSRKRDVDFVNSLKPADRAIYDLAVRKRQDILNLFGQLHQ